MRVYTVEEKQSQTTLQANLKVVLSISCDTSSNSYSSKNTVNIDENMIRSIKIGGNFIAYLTIKGQVFAVYYNVRENGNSSPVIPGSLIPSLVSAEEHGHKQRRTVQFPPTAGPGHTLGGAPDSGKRKRRHSHLTEAVLELEASKRRQLSVPSTPGPPGGGGGGGGGGMSSVATTPGGTDQPGNSASTPDQIRARTTAAAAATELISLHEDVSFTEASPVQPGGGGGGGAGGGPSSKRPAAPPIVPEEPEVSQPVQWRNSCNNPIYFTMISTTKCAVLLVCGLGRLWRWDMTDNTFEEHPLYRIYCGDKAITQISTSNLRITLLLETGELAVFYDTFISDTQPMIISQLSHPAEHFPSLENEVVREIKTSDFRSVALTQSGKVFWWGMQQKDRSLIKTKGKAGRRNSIKAGSQVVLKSTMNDILNGSLVYTAYPQSRLGRVEGCSNSGVVVRLCGKDNAETVRTETWSNSQTEVLETNVVPLGTVIGIHGTNAIIMTCKISDPLFRTEWKQYRRMFSEGQLDKLDEDVDMDHGPRGTSSRPHPPMPHEDHSMEIDGSSIASDASHPTSAYPNLCVYPVSELEVHDSNVQFSHCIQRVPTNLLENNTTKLHEFKGLSICVDHLGNITVLAAHKETGAVYMLTKDSISEECEAIKQEDAHFLTREQGQVEMLSTPDSVLMVDTHSLPFVPPLPTCLNFREFNYFPAVCAIDVKQEIDTTPGKSRLIVAVAKKEQLAMPLILQGDFKYFVQLRSQADNPIQGSPNWSDVVRALETERDSCGRTCLHVCAIARCNPKFKTPKQATPSNYPSLLPIKVDESLYHSITLVKRSVSFEELRYRHYAVERQRQHKEHDRWLNVMKFICNIETLNLANLLCLTDNAGYTPFTAAVASKNYNNAWYLLPILATLEKDHPGTLDRAVWRALLFDTSVLHILAQDKLHTAVIVQAIPSWCTEQTLQNLFGQNYPSLYKVLLQQKPKNVVKSVGRKLFDMAKPMTVRDRILRSFIRDSPTAAMTSNLYQKSNSKQLQGILFFSDPLEARKALIQMEGYVFPSRNAQTRPSYRASFFGYSAASSAGFFHVSMRFVEREVRGFYLSHSKKRKTRIKEEFEVLQEHSRRLILQTLLTHSQCASVNVLAETPLANLVNESIFSKMEDKKRSENLFPTDIPVRGRARVVDTRRGQSSRTTTTITELSDISENFSDRYRDRESSSLPSLPSPSSFSGSGMFLLNMPGIASIPSRPPAFYCGPRTIDSLLASRARSNLQNNLIVSSRRGQVRRDLEAEDIPDIMGTEGPDHSITTTSLDDLPDRANFSMQHGSDIEDEGTSSMSVSSFGRLDSTFSRLYAELNQGQDRGPSWSPRPYLDSDPRGHADFDLVSSLLSSVGGDDSNEAHFSACPREDVVGPEEVGGDVADTSLDTPDISFTSYVLRGLGGSSAAADQPSSSSTTSEPTAKSPFNTADFKHENDESSELIWESTTQLPPSLPHIDSVRKQLCDSPRIVMTTIYCCYTNTRTLPTDLEEMLARKRKRSSSSSSSSCKITLSDIKGALSRADGTLYSPEMMGFTHNLIANTECAGDIADTLVKLMRNKTEGGVYISVLFVRSLVRYLSLQLTNVGPRECLPDLPEHKLIVDTRSVLKKFGWLAVHEIFMAAEALFLPLQYNTFKAQALSSVSDHHIYPNPPGFNCSSGANQPVSLHPSTYLRQCPIRSDLPKTPAPPKRKLSLVIEQVPDDEHETSGDEVSDEDSATDDVTHSILTNINFLGVMDNFLNSNSPNTNTATDEDPLLMWAVDGQTSTFRPVFRAQHNPEEVLLLKENSTERGKNILACVFSRLVKVGADIAREQVGQETIVLCSMLRSEEEKIIERWWIWLQPIISSLEVQLRKAKEFNLEKHNAMLKKGEKRVRSLYNPGSANKNSITASFPQEYIMYLLDSHTADNCSSLPLLDIKGYKHIVYLFDTMYYVTLHWPSNSSGKETRSSAGSSSSSSGPSGSGSGGQEKSFLKRSMSLEFDHSITGNDLERSVELHLPLALQPHLLTPLATRESLFTTKTSKPSSSGAQTALGGESLKLARRGDPLLKQNPGDFISTYEMTVKIFSSYYLGDGPGTEQGSVLNLKANYSGKMARFSRQIKEMKLLVQSQNIRHDARDIVPRIYNLYIYVNRTRLLTDSIKCLLEMSHLQPVNYSVKFEGEEGGGPGVNRGWFSVMCTALRDLTKYPEQTLPLLYCPGRIPEQADIYAPQPWSFPSPSSALYKQRLDGLKAIGRYFGLALWFRQTLPLKLCRHVWKYLLGRKLCWADLAFYNADLYEGLRAMVNDAKWMTDQEFVEVYPCRFEVESGGELRELCPGGTEKALTKINIEEYIQGYSMMLMVQSVEQELAALKQGFSDIIPQHILCGLTAEDLTLLLSGGSGDISYERLHGIVNFVNSIGCSQKRLDQFKRWFWRIVKEMSQKERQQLLYFATGSSTLPPLDLTGERTRDRVSITVEIQHDSRSALPMASTCGQRISIPLYRSFQMLKCKLSTALQCQTYNLG